MASAHGRNGWRLIAYCTASSSGSESTQNTHAHCRRPARDPPDAHRCAGSGAAGRRQARNGMQRGVPYGRGGIVATSLQAAALDIYNPCKKKAYRLVLEFRLANNLLTPPPLFVFSFAPLCPLLLFCQRREACHPCGRLLRPTQLASSMAERLRSRFRFEARRLA